MKMRFVSVLVLLVMSGVGSVSYALEIGPFTVFGFDGKGTWEQKYDAAGTTPPFSFVYGGRPSGELLRNWQFEAEHKKLDENRISHVLTWLDPQTGLEVRWKGLEFTDFESIEWTIYLRNTATTESLMVEDIKSLNMDLRRGRSQEYVLRHWKGTLVKAEDFASSSTVLEAGQKLTFRPDGVRLTGTAGEWPYYNLDAGGEGIILVVGWPGRWYVSFQRDGEAGLHVTAGQEVTHFRLSPGETVRTPLFSRLSLLLC